jgi:hypothetical protein
MSHAVDTDQRLRGRGHPIRDIPHQSSATHAKANSAIGNLIKAQKALVEQDRGDFFASLNQWVESHRGPIAIGGIALGIIGIVLTF